MAEREEVLRMEMGKVGEEGDTTDCPALHQTHSKGGAGVETIKSGQMGDAYIYECFSLGEPAIELGERNGGLAQWIKALFSKPEDLSSFQNPLGGRRDPTLAICPLMSTCMHEMLTALEKV